MNFITHTLRNKCETNMAVIITQTHPLKKCEKNYEHHHTPPCPKMRERYGIDHHGDTAAISLKKMLYMVLGFCPVEVLREFDYTDGAAKPARDGKRSASKSASPKRKKERKQGLQKFAPET